MFLSNVGAEIDGGGGSSTGYLVHILFLGSRPLCPPCDTYSHLDEIRPSGNRVGHCCGTQAKPIFDGICRRACVICKSILI